MKRLYIIAGISLLLGACNKFGDINVDPNRPSETSSTQLIANAELYLPVLGESPQAEYFAQYLSETQYPNLSLYNQVSSSFYSLYYGPLMNLDSVIRSTKLDATEGPIANQLAVAKILKAYYFWHITDRWGDVPYQEALKGSANTTPVYDSQESIYTSLFLLLDEADKSIVAGDIINDIVYQGNMARWKKLGNTIRLLMALRLSVVKPEIAKTEFNKALTAGIMTSNVDNLVFAHLPEAANESYWYDQITDQNRKWWALSESLVNKMKPVNDPRLPVYGDKNSAGQYVGLKYGATDGLSTTAFSLLGAEIRKQNANVYLVTYAQALFAKAEAAKLGWIPDGDVAAEANYKSAIEQSVRQWKNNDTTGFGVMMASPGMAYVPATAYEQIGNQRWVHLFMHGFEAWAEWRRTGFPAGLIKPDGKDVPSRQGYPQDEVFNNKVHYEDAVRRQFPGGDNLYGKLWWDK
ncbi:SusD/RagB family nutrient-binding outer membrane lipoprotein [Chitinophaga sp. SYP-B3965]|uniref:SusD/RagB family nutrient-binding outer membrane lipoprotein n=1 Tax=Chitinophaga sp. SYP-B3965 TaxID=2663120 RepID=UPI001299D6B1|nr:SusD/RagB family nutrient-binding outer membrane lipoprotein [Chitinophaga sp. SYP-B3965]MRG47207.1 SusD/RagB family nutrient-binding outer membrane lipoprotein [Chitinophaga sp. SYP-B3965]